MATRLIIVIIADEDNMDNKNENDEMILIIPIRENSEYRYYNISSLACNKEIEINRVRDYKTEKQEKKREREREKHDC